MAVNIRVDVSNMKRLRKAIFRNSALRIAVARAWSTIYRSFVRQHFHKSSRGGGDWAPLAASTKRQRRGSGSQAAILRDTGALFASLQPTLMQGGLMQTEPLSGLGFRATLSGGGNYKTGATLAQVASFHHAGAGRLPKREILVEPDAATVRNMGQHGKRLIAKYARNR